MKRNLLSFAAASLLFTSCNSCGNSQDGTVVETITDSITIVNDTVPPATQTFIFQGTSPMNGNKLADVVLAISTVSLNSDGTYTIVTDYVDEGIATQNDNGEAIIVAGMDNDSTMTVIELVSANNNPSMNFVMQQDSTLVKADKSGKPLSNNPAHKLSIKKQ